ncbi:hypothetical protein KC318_g3068 [Hortaea werneckii]|nr:hypothetical protein KC334_g615 [Hortaea werneckii]KAI7013297.1 hypothetical protein KC355_g5095 [Hortaea werneckii]KAI7672109.1 hypothetical protein KC318_g3068 [Hortaea werneckii]
MSQRDDHFEAANTVLRTQASTEFKPCQKAKEADLAFTYFEHLKVCKPCREHEIEAFGDRIKVLKQLDPSHNSDDDENSPVRQADLKREIILKKIPPGKYREVKNWPAGSLGDAPVLLYTTDGSEFGIRREKDDEFLHPESRSSRDGGDTSLLASNASEEIPFRLVFNSTDLMKILEVTEDEITATNPVHVRPFKYLLKHESKIRSMLEQIQQALHKRPCDSSIAATEASQGQTTGLSTTETDSTTVKGVPVTERSLKLLQCLMGFVDNEMRDVLAVRKQIAGGTLEEISFEYLLHLFKPGDLVSADPRLPSEERRAYRVLYLTGGRPLFESSEERRQRLKKGSDGVETEEVPEIGGFELLPDDIVSQGSQGRATKMTPLVIDCFYIDYDGINYGPRPQRFVIPEFGGRKKIVDLDVHPARFDPACETVRGKLLKRGRHFVERLKRPHKEYHGYVLSDRTAILSADDDGALFMIYNDPSLRSEVFQLDCECVIDQKATLDRYTPFTTRDVKGATSMNKLGFHSGVLSKPTDSNQGELFDKLGKDKDQTDIYDDSKFDIDLRTQFMAHTSLLSSSPEITGDEQFELLPLRLFGYALQKRKWCAFNVLHLKEPPAMKETERNKAFNALVLPEELRRSIRALVSHQVREITMPKDKFDDTGDDVPAQRALHKFDLIQGKGEGIILLFHGNPGVGKTTTAESVAIQLQRPLLPITCGDLGEQPYEVEKKLSTFFFLGAKWRCVVLLDEADVFLARRTTGDLKRNSLVSIFLRQLEYYSGLLILTTNRVGEFDEAFVSRIHMKLHFPSLDESSTMEIKNAFQTAVALAYWDWEQEKQEALAKGKKAKEKPVLRKSHFEDVAKTSLHFDNSMDKLYGAVGIDGKRRKGAFVREAERLRYRHDDRAQELPPPIQYARGGGSSTAGKPASATANASTLTVDDLQRQLDALRAGTPVQASSSATAGASRDDASSSEDSSDEDSEED